MGEIAEKLKEINKFITIGERQEYAHHFNKIFNYFINQMKKDAVFSKLYNGDDMAGMYIFDLLRIMENV